MDAELRTRLAGAINDALYVADGTEMRFDDCLIWLADIYFAVLGADPADQWRSRYKTEEQMTALLGRRGVAGAMWCGARAMGWARIDPKKAQTGDLGMIVTERGPAGVIRNGEFWVGRDDYGFAVISTDFVRRAWSVC